MKVYEITEDAPTMTGKQAALKKQQQAALLKSKTTDPGMVDRMNIVGKGMQDKVNKAQADADSLSRAAGIDPKTVQKDIKKSLAGKPKFKNKFRKTTETTASAIEGAYAGGGNGFVNGGPGTIQRANTTTKPKKKKKTTKNA